MLNDFRLLDYLAKFVYKGKRERMSNNSRLV